MMKKEQSKQGLREFGLTSLSVDNGISVILLAVMILIFGIDAYNRMPKEQFPEVSLPTVYINTQYFGNSAVDIENLVTRPIEKELQGISEIDDILSTSVQDFSAITTEFTTEVDIDDAVRKVKDAVDRADSELPDDLTEDPQVFEVNLSEIPIMTINLSGDYSMDDLREHAEYLEEEIEQLNEISDIEMKGALEREMKVNIDISKMQSMEVSYEDVENAIKAENVTMSGGELEQNNFRRAIRVVGEFDNAEQIANIIVKSENNKPVYLKDIAEVTFGYKERDSYARSDGLPVISLDVIKREGENLLFAADKIKGILDRARENTLPDDLTIQIFNDQSVNTRREVNNLENSIISGVILVTLVLLFFLGFRNALFVGVAIPLSMLTGILVLYLMGITMNIVVLFSLILALGLLVDNGIVVVENIYRHMQEGWDGFGAAKYGTGEVALPIIASTATTLAAFVPLAFWPGLMGTFMQYLPITLIIVLASSLFVALVINPVLTSRFMNVDEPADKEAKRRRRKRNVLIFAGAGALLSVAAHFLQIELLRNLLGLVVMIALLHMFVLRPGAFYFQRNFMPWLEIQYNHFVRAVLSGWRPLLTFCGTFVLLIVAILLLWLNAPKVILFPDPQPQYVNVFVEMPIGTEIEETNRIVERVENRVQKAIEPYDRAVEAVLAQVGKNTSDPSGPPDPGGDTPNKARITVSFHPFEERGGVNTFDVMDAIRNSVQGFAGVKITVDRNQAGPVQGKPINLEISGEDIDRLVLLADDVDQYIENKNIPGIEELQIDVQLAKPEMIVNIDREAARRYGLSTFAVADALRTSVFGKEVSQFKQGEDEYPIFVRASEQYRHDVTALRNQSITFRDAATGRINQVPISAVADVEYTTTYSSIKRKDLDRVVTIYSNVLEGYNANEIIAEMTDYLESYDFPAGYSWEFTGQQEQQEETQAFLNVAFIIAIFSIFIIIVAQFNSMISPFIIILSVLFSTIGVFLGYAATGRDVVIVMTGVGIISLAGIVVNNAIVLIDYINLLIKRKRQELDYDRMSQLSFEDVREAIIDGGATRLRPVLLTAITTVLGLVPLALGINFNFFTLLTDLDPNYFRGGESVAFWGPMAWTVIYGLIFATFLTLVVVPVMYWLAYQLNAWYGQMMYRFGFSEVNKGYPGRGLGTDEDKA